MVTAVEHPLALRLRNLTARFEQLLRRRERTILWGGIITFVVVFTALAAWKLWAGGYNALDLAIYRQVAANSVRGNFFGLTINPHNYLGDHVELFFAVLWPFYALFKQPITLLFLQNAALALAAIPIARISSRLLGKPWHLLFALAYLANPMVQNMALFEFHMLPFAIPILAFAILAYIDQKYRAFILWSMLAMTVREDVALVIIGFGLLALADRRHWRWVVVPLVLGGAWFFGALKLTGLMSGYGHYKFLAYYGWLGDGPLEILRTIITRPWLVLQHLLRVPRLGLALALLLPFAYLPLLRPRWLIPAAPIVAQIFLAGATGDVVVDTHYPSLLIPFLLVAVMAVFSALRQQPSANPLRFLSRERGATLFVYSAVVLYSMLSLGPLLQSIPIVAASPRLADRVRLQQAVEKSLPAGAVVAGPEDITRFSDRPRLYSLHYVWLGQKQFSEEPYILPDDASTIVINQRDFLTFRVLHGDPTKGAGYGQIRSVLTERNFVLTTTIDRYSIFQRRVGAATDFGALFSESVPAGLTGEGSSHGSLTFLGWAAPNQKLSVANQEFGGQVFRVLPLDLVFIKQLDKKKVYQLEFTFTRGKKVVYRQLMPLGGGLFPTSDWTVNRPVVSHYRLLLPSTLHGLLDMNVRVVGLEGALGLNGVRSAIPVYSKYETIGPTISLGRVSL